MSKDALRYHDDRETVVAAIYQRDGEKCHYCRRLLANLQQRSMYYAIKLKSDFRESISQDEYTFATTFDVTTLPTIDHKVPRSKGGSHGIDNLVVCCKSCNSRKKNRPYEQYAPSNGAES